MRQEFELTLCNYARYTWLGIVGMLASLGFSLGICVPLLPHSGGFLGIVLTFFLCLYGVHQLMKRFTLRRALIEVLPTGLRVRYLSANQEVAIDFADVSAYRDEQLKDGRELRFRLRSGQKIKLATNHFLGPAGDYEALLHAVQVAMAHHNATAPVAISREKSFFEKPFSTILLVACGGALLCTVSLMLTRHRPITGSLFTALGSFVSYLAMWYRARMRTHA